MELRVLGSLEVVGEGGVVPLPAAKHRRLLAALAVSAGRTHPVDALVDAVWGASPPASARKLLQIYVSQLRKTLPNGAAVVTRPAGYALDLNGVSLDADRFERLLEEAADARRDGNPALAGSLAERALELWSGPAYADVAYEDFARGEAERLEELRLVAVEERLDARLALGGGDQLLGEALAFAREHPLRERPQQLAMVALYRAGRQTEALELFAEVRARLDELGLEPGTELRELQRRILQQDPALDVAAAGDATASLPTSPNPLIGRERELRELRELLVARRVRLLVLTGAGGSGKTRLALEAARRSAGTFANGAALVELAPVQDPGLVLPTIAHALDVADVSDEAPLDVLGAALHGRELLLVIDNAEHVREAAPLLAELIKRAPRLTLLVTSRAVLHLSGEHVFPVGPLDDDAALDLFDQRARALSPGFAVTAENEPHLREICRRVDALPLAVELAAARVRTLTPEALLGRLSRRLAFLAGGPHDLPARQQTLIETLDWSYELLQEDERAFLARLSVFVGSFTVEAAAAVCLADDGDAALELVERLADASLVVVERHGAGMRCRLLETVRQYAADRLAGIGQRETAQRHAEWCLALAEEAEAELSGEHQAQWFATLEAEHDNARAALAFLEATGQQELQLRLTVALSRFWYVRGYLVEGRRRLEEALEHRSDQAPLLLRRGLTAAASIALLQGDYAASAGYAEGALEAARSAGEPRFVANALSNLGAIVLAGGDEERAGSVLEEAVALAREVGDQRIAALAINNLGDLALTRGDYGRAGPLFEESHALLQARGDSANIARSLFNLGAVDLMLGRGEAARDRFRRGLELAGSADDKEDIAWCLEGLAALAAEDGDGERASTLLGAAGGLLNQIGADFKPFERQLHDATVERARSVSGDEAHAAACANGASLPLAAVLDLALAPVGGDS